MPQDSAGLPRRKGEDRSGLPAGRPAGPGAAPWQGHEESGERRDGRWLRTALFGLAGVAAIAGVAWLIRFLAPTEATLIVVVSEAFPPTDLSLPAGIYERKAAEDFLAVAKNEKVHRWEVLAQRGRDEPWPVDFTGRDSWIQALDRTKQRRVLIYVSQPGGADALGRPFVFGAAGQPLLVADLLAAVQRVARSSQKLVVFDATQTPTDWRHGLLTNDFAGGLARLMNDAPFKDDNSLFVIASTSPNQRSWAPDESGGGVFARYLRDGLSGAALSAGSDGPVTVAALHQYLAAQVDGWARRNRAADAGPFAQVPVLLPEGAAGRAANFIVAYGDPQRQPSAKATPDAAATKQYWQRHDELAGHEPGPWVSAPRTWRRFRELLLRHEALAWAGRDTKPVAEAINQLAGVLDRERTLSRGTAALAVSLSMPAALGRQKRLSPADMERLCTDEPADKIVNGADTATRIAALGALYDLAMQAQTPVELDRLARRMMQIDSGRQARPAEAHLAVMLSAVNPSLLPGGFERPNISLVRQALNTRRLAEQAALAAQSGQRYPYCQHLPAALWDLITRADQDRRRAEDLLFVAAPYPDGRDPVQRLNDAIKGYEEVIKSYADVQAALAVRDRVFADLPFLAEWVALGPPKADANAAVSVSLWREAHNLADRLMATDPLAPPDAPGVGKAGLGELTKRVREDFEYLLKAYVSDVKAVLGADENTQRRLQGIVRVLIVPGLMSPDERTSLLKRRSEITAYLANSQSSPAERGSSAPSEAHLARHQGALAAAMLRQDPANAVASELAGSYRQMAADVDKLAGDGKPAEFSLRRERVALLAPTRATLGDEPALQGRDLRWNEVFRRLARRAELDHWYDETGEPFSDTLAQNLYKAISPQEGNEKANQLRQRQPSGELVIQPLAPLVFTSQPSDTATFRVREIKSPAFEPGYVAIQARPVNFGGVHLAEPPRPRWIEVDRPAEFSVRLKFDGPDRMSQKMTDDIPLAVHYRGQHGHGKIVAQATILPFPDLTVVHPPRPAGAQFTVRAGDDFNQGALAIILDCSGSMREPNAAGTGEKFDDAKRALFELFDDIPKGTEVCLYAYGHKGERSVERERIANLTRWNQAANDRFRAEVRNLKAQGYTPLLDAMVEAADYLAQSRSVGNRTLVVLSDGCHLTQPGDDTDAGADRIAQRFADEFVTKKSRGVAVRLILFAPGNQSAIARRQFRAIGEVQPSGTIVDATNYRELAQQLGRSVRPVVSTFRNGGRMPGEFHALLPRDPLDWFPREKLAAGDYTVQVPGLDRQRIALRDGEKLPLRLVTKGGRGGFVRDILAFDKESRITPLTTEADRGYVVGLFGRGELAESDQGVRGRFTLEDRENALEFKPLLSVDQPKFIWWELKPDKAVFPTGLRVTQLSGESAPAWELRAKPFGGLNRAPVMDVWCLRDEPAATEFKFTGVPLTKQTAGDADLVQVTAAIENFPIPSDEAGQEMKPERCLVVRLRGGNGRLFTVELADHASAADVQAYYLLGKASYVTAAFRANPEGGNAETRFRVISVDTAKVEADQQKTRYRYRFR